MVKRGTDPTFEKATRLAEALGLEVSFIDRETGQPVGPDRPPLPPVTSKPLLGSGFSLIPRYEVRASAGTGLAVLTEDVIDALAFNTEWLRRMGVDPAFAGLVQAFGDSMAPTIPDGALMLVDMRNDQLIRHGCIYVILKDGDLIVKRVDRSPKNGSVELISDNKRYRKQTVTTEELSEMPIPGRVVWVGNAL
jgi:phage repressor protein C with HTH and peptisase S24 domain